MTGKMLDTFNILGRSGLIGSLETYTDTGGSTRTQMAANAAQTDSGQVGYTIEMNAPAAEGVVTNGIICGSSTTAVLASDIAIGTLITHGDINGTLHYMNMTVGTRVVSGDGSCTQEFTRIVTNNGTVDVTINEVAYYAKVRYQGNTAHYNVCVYREVLTTPIVVTPTQSATIRCTLSIPCLII